MKLTLNFEAPGYTTWELTGIMHDLFASPITRIRVQPTSYQGPEGPVHARTLVAEVVTPLNYDSIVEAAYALSDRLGQDCIAMVPHEGVGVLVGPRADKWLPFNPAYFLEY